MGSFHICDFSASQFWWLILPVPWGADICPQISLERGRVSPHELQRGSPSVYSLQVPGGSFVADQTGFPGGLGGKESACQCRSHRRLGFYAWVRKIPWRRNPLQYSSQDNPMNREAWWATVHGVTESDMTEQASKAKQSNLTSITHINKSSSESSIILMHLKILRPKILKTIIAYF